MTDQEKQEIGELFAEQLANAVKVISNVIEQEGKDFREFMKNDFLPKVGNNVYSRNMTFTKQVLTTAEVAEMLGIKVKSVDQRVRRGRLRGHTDEKGRLFFYRSELDEDLFRRKPKEDLL